MSIVAEGSVGVRDSITIDTGTYAVMAVKNIFVTGTPGTGKTTLIKDLIKELDLDADGFFTQEVRKGHERVGFDIRTLDGRDGVLASVGIKSPFRVGKYGVTLEDLNSIGVSAIERAVREKKVVVIDEVGRMELFSEAFKDAVLRALESDSPVLGTVKLVGDPFTDGIKERSDTTVIELTRENRDGVKRRVKELLLRA